MNLLSLDTTDKSEYHDAISELKRRLDYIGIAHEESFDRLGFESGLILQHDDLLEFLNYISIE